MDQEVSQIDGGFPQDSNLRKVSSPFFKEFYGIYYSAFSPLFIASVSATTLDDRSDRSFAGYHLSVRFSSRQ